MQSIDFGVGQTYFQARLVDEREAPWLQKGATLLVVETWVFQGVFSLPEIAASSEKLKPHSVFQRYGTGSNVLADPPEQGLRCPLDRPAGSQMLTVKQLINQLTEMKIERPPTSEYLLGATYFFPGNASGQSTPWNDKDRTVLVVDTWVYQGYFKLDWNTLSCDIPHHFLVFQPFLSGENVLARRPENGLKVPSKRCAELCKLTVDTLIESLKELSEQHQ